MARPAFLDAIRAWAQTDAAKRWARVFNGLLFVGVLGWLLYQIYRIGWVAVLAALPTEPLFYLLFLIGYLLPPFVEGAIYGHFWRVPLRRSLPALLIKKVYNNVLLGASGEVYLYVWARRNTEASERAVFRLVRDNNILSSVATTGIAVALLGALLATGQIAVFEQIPSLRPFVNVGVMLAVVALLGLAWRFRRHLIALRPAEAWGVAAAHGGRFILGRLLDVAMWIVVLPAVPLAYWWTFLALKIVVSRIPFLANRDLVFLALSIELARLMEMPPVDIAGLMLATSLVTKLVNAAAYALASYYDRRPLSQPLRDDGEQARENAP